MVEFKYDEIILRGISQTLALSYIDVVRKFDMIEAIQIVLSYYRILTESPQIATLVKMNILSFSVINSACHLEHLPNHKLQYFPQENRLNVVCHAGMLKIFSR